MDRLIYTYKRWQVYRTYRLSYELSFACMVSHSQVTLKSREEDTKYYRF